MQNNHTKTDNMRNNNKGTNLYNNNVIKVQNGINNKNILNAISA